MAEPTSTQAFRIANDTDFQKRVRLIALDVATDVLAEANTTANHNDRAKYALTLLANQLAESQRIAFVVVADNADAVAGASSQSDFGDDAIKTAISAAWNHLSGVYVPEA